MKTILHALTGLTLSAAVANAAIDSFTAANGTTGPNIPPTLNSSYGTVDVALNLGGASLTYDGISFTGNTVTSASNTVLWATVGGISVGATTDVGATWNTATGIVSGSSTYNSTFGTEAWSDKSGGGSFQTINISGLDAGKSYQIQLMHGEDRSIGNGFSYIGQLTATDSALNTANTTLQFGDENDADTYVFGVVTLEVSGVTGVDINYPFRDALFPDAGVSDRDPSLAGIVISSVAGSAPVVTGRSPADNATNVAIDTNLVMTFSETVQKSTGKIYVRTGGSAVQTIDVTTAAVTLSTTTFTNDTVTVDISDLANATDYAIRIDAGAFEDTLGADFAGIGDDTTWNFSTGTPLSGSILSFTAVNGTTGPNTPPTLDNTYGTLEMAINLGNGSGGTIDLDGITFTNNNVTSATNTVTWATVGGISVGATTDVGATWSVATNIVSGSPGPSSLYNNTFGTEAWSNKSGGGVFQTINISGLDAGKSYQIQLMHGEDRSIGNGFDYAGTLVATDDNSNTADVFFRFGDENDQNTYVFGVVTLVVSGTTSVDIHYPDRSVAASGDRDPSLAGIVIHSVTASTPPFETWAGGTWSGTLSNTDPTLDFDNGGLDTGIEWVVGGDPTLGSDDAGNAPTLDNSDPSDFKFVFKRRDDAAADTNTVIAVQYGTDLSGWATATDGVDGVSIDDSVDLGGGFHEVTVSIPRTLAPGGKLFARLSVKVTP
jgi:hypothetical protein